MSYQHITVQKATRNVGAYLSGFDLNNVTNEAIYAEIQRAVHEFGVVFMRKQPLEPAAFVRLGKAFGNLESAHPVFGSPVEHPEIQLIKFNPDAPIETQAWHTDNTYNEFPSAYTFLRAVDIPPVGGDTLWASNAAVYDDLSAPVQEMLEKFWVRHDLYWRFRESNYLRRAGKEGTDANIMPLVADHPMIIKHPVTGRKQIFAHRHFCSVVHHVHEEISRTLLDMLFNMVKQPDYQVRLTWEKDTVAIWDNWATQHYATLDYSPYPRSMTRMVGTSKFRPEPVDASKMLEHSAKYNQNALLDRKAVAVAPTKAVSRAMM
jgi:taurine dioxygenase